MFRKLLVQSIQTHRSKESIILTLIISRSTKKTENTGLKFFGTLVRASSGNRNSQFSKTISEQTFQERLKNIRFIFEFSPGRTLFNTSWKDVTAVNHKGQTDMVFYGISMANDRQRNDFQLFDGSKDQPQEYVFTI